MQNIHMMVNTHLYLTNKCGKTIFHNMATLNVQYCDARSQ